MKRLALFLLFTACGPGDAPFSMWVRGVDIEIGHSSINALGLATCTDPHGIQFDLGLMQPGQPGMVTSPRHLHFEPGIAGVWSVSDIIDPNVGLVGKRIRGHRPQELRFTPGQAMVTITGSAY